MKFIESLRSMVTNRIENSLSPRSFIVVKVSFFQSFAEEITSKAGKDEYCNKGFLNDDASRLRDDMLTSNVFKIFFILVVTRKALQKLFGYV